MLNRKLYPIGVLALPLAGLAGVFVGGTPAGAIRLTAVEALRSVAALPPHLTGKFGEPAAFQQDAEGNYYVVDRRGHTVSRIDHAMTAVTPLVAIGHELGRILLPFGFDLGEGEFAIADAPTGAERVQVFTTSGSRVAAFTLGQRAEPRIQLGGLVLNGAGSMRFTRARTILLSQPESGALVTEYDIRGRALGSFGALRSTAHDADPQLRMALNASVLVPAADGGLYVIFQAGEPRFRRYGPDHRLLYERVVQGPELDGLLQSQPTVWPRRKGRAGGEIPVVTPIVRTAALDRAGRLWISLTLPYTYVYDASGEKLRTVQLHGAGILSPTSLSFSPDGRLLVTPGCYVFAP